ncbi:MAG: hypothetical protein ABI443_02300 [Chthoniobacterales bacterium]
MSDLPPSSRDQNVADEDHLKLLAIFHFVIAGFTCLGILFLFGHYMIFHSIFDNPNMLKGPYQGPSPTAFFAIFNWFYLIFGVWLVSYGILNVISGFFLLKRKYGIFSLIVAAINCLFIPFGTALGICTIIILMRPSVKEMYRS